VNPCQTQHNLCDRAFLVPFFVVVVVRAKRSSVQSLVVDFQRKAQPTHFDGKFQGITSTGVAPESMGAHIRQIKIINIILGFIRRRCY
jgi:hypothetical protein